MSDLPRGIYYEAARKRYRVRVYKFSKVTHRSYHRDLPTALLALEAALEHRDGVQPPKKKVAAVASVKNLLGDLISRPNKRHIWK